MPGVKFESTNWLGSRLTAVRKLNPCGSAAVVRYMRTVVIRLVVRICQESSTRVAETALATRVSFPWGVGLGLGVGTGVAVGAGVGVAFGVGVGLGVEIGVGVGNGLPDSRTEIVFDGLDSKTPPARTVLTKYR